MPNGSPFLHTAQNIYSQSPGGPMEDLARAQIYAQIQQAQFMLPVELERKQQLGELEAELAGKEWEAKYTARDKAEIARKYNALKQMKQSGLFNDVEMLAATRQVLGDVAGIEPDFFPKSEQQKLIDELTEDGRPPGVPWKAEDGGWYSTEFDDNGRPKIRLLVRPDQTFEALQLKAQQELQKEMRERRAKLATEEIAVKKPEQKERGWFGAGKEKPEYDIRTRTEQEIDAIMQAIYGATQQQAQPQQANVPVVIRTKAERDALPPGAIYIYNGQQFQKPNEQSLQSQPSLPTGLSPFALSY